jgi:type VI secretion system secreted protein VgrG
MRRKLIAARQSENQEPLMSAKCVRVLSGAGLAAILCGVAVVRAQTTLGTAQPFAVVGGSTVTNTGLTTVTGDLGVSPGSAVVGFAGPPNGTVTGTIHAMNAVALQAQNDLTTYYNLLENAPCTEFLTGQDLGGMILTSGVYCFATSAQLTGNLTLNAEGNAAATFVFRIGSTLTTASGSSVLLINGGNPCGVGWQIGSSATLGTTTSFIGNLAALTSITLNTGANILGGRALARNGAVTLDTNNITFAPCAVAGPIPPVPTLATWAVIALIGLLALAGFATLRRRESL